MFNFWIHSFSFQFFDSVYNSTKRHKKKREKTQKLHSFLFHVWFIAIVVTDFWAYFLVACVHFCYSCCCVTRIAMRFIWKSRIGWAQWSISSIYGIAIHKTGIKEMKFGSRDMDLWMIGDKQCKMISYGVGVDTRIKSLSSLSDCKNVFFFSQSKWNEICNIASFCYPFLCVCVSLFCILSPFFHSTVGQFNLTSFWMQRNKNFINKMALYRG